MEVSRLTRKMAMRVCLLLFHLVVVSFCISKRQLESTRDLTVACLSSGHGGYSMCETAHRQNSRNLIQLCLNWEQYTRCVQSVVVHCPTASEAEAAELLASYQVACRLLSQEVTLPPRPYVAVVTLPVTIPTPAGGPEPTLPWTDQSAFFTRVQTMPAPVTTERPCNRETVIMEFEKCEVIFQLMTGGKTASELVRGINGVENVNANTTCGAFRRFFQCVMATNAACQSAGSYVPASSRQYEPIAQFCQGKIQDLARPLPTTCPPGLGLCPFLACVDLYNDRAAAASGPPFTCTNLAHLMACVHDDSAGCSAGPAQSRELQLLFQQETSKWKTWCNIQNIDVASLIDLDSDLDDATCAAKEAVASQRSSATRTAAAGTLSIYLAIILQSYFFAS